MEIDKALYKACEDNIKLEEQLDKYKKVIDKLKEYIENDILCINEEVGIGSMIYDKLNELLEEVNE